MKNALIAVAMICLACGGAETQSTSTADAKTRPKAAPPPTVVEAKNVIENSQDWSEYQFTNAAYTLPLKRSAMNEPAQKAAEDLAAAKWIRFKGDDVELTEQASGDKRFLVRPNGYVDLVPIAKKECGNVTAVRANADGTVSADFDWKWIPNEVGQSFKSGLVKERFDAAQRATAKLMWDGKSWTVLRIDPIQ